jgi:hypothetical protein
MYTVEVLKWVTYDVLFFQNIPVGKGPLVFTQNI